MIKQDSLVASIENNNFQEDLFEVYSNYPNPYSDETAVSFKIRNSEMVSLTIYDSLGNKVSDYIKNEQYNEGKHTIIIDNKKLQLTSGIYLYSLKINSSTKSFKMIIH
jgi:hypothetical protein